SAVALGIGIGIQNFPEGFAVSMPLRRAGFSRRNSWKWGQLSAIVEPIFAVIGAAIVTLVFPILPYALAFAAGAMQASSHRNTAGQGNVESLWELACRR
ncbi:MAG: ZIP family metal transporter, partial [Pseudomonas sp.]|uniref:ZIP family metal transporter n=1 Tax=Pseudomonas sp. TaxID=306 RepID=UPI0039820BB1